jgi:hypothetical protein
MDGNDHERGIVLPTFGTQNLKRQRTSHVAVDAVPRYFTDWFTPKKRAREAARVPHVPIVHSRTLK